MANTQYIRANRLANEAKQSRKLVLFIGAPIVLILCVLFPAASFLFLIPFFIIFLSALNAGAIKVAGAKGEDLTLGLLATLPNSYTILNQIELPNPEAKKGFTELDFIVIGPNGIFVIEVKNNNGRIVGSEDEKEWTVYKVGRKGTPYTSSLRNPIKQLKGQIWILSRWLKERGHKAWIDGVVYFSNPDSDIEFLGTPSFPIFHNSGLTNYIQSYQPKSPLRDPDKIVQTLLSLRK